VIFSKNKQEAARSRVEGRMAKSPYDKADRKTLIRIIREQAKLINELRARTVDDYLRQLIREYQ